MSNLSQPLTIAAVGCGSRARTYSQIAASLGDRYRITAGADPVPQRLEAMREISDNPEFQGFDSADALLAQDRLADVLIIGTQDNYHFEPAKKALEKGYHLLLEKPAAQSLEEVNELARLAKKYDRKILLCFVLRYTPFYSKVHEIIRSGRLGDIITIHAAEGVDAWHHTHSYVRGNWSRTDLSTPMIIAKCSHDTDYISWFMNSRCTSVSSYGRLSHFTSAHAPEGAADRCTSGCPHAAPQGGNCPYDAHHYLDKHARWLRMVYPHPTERNKDDIIKWLESSPWGRCAWKCDNNAVDHQVVSMEFENGNTASLTMTAFDCAATSRFTAPKPAFAAATPTMDFQTKISLSATTTAEKLKPSRSNPLTMTATKATAAATTGWSMRWMPSSAETAQKAHSSNTPSKVT
ncbi:Gfo/Idh/MocA family protein [Rubritalea profundi]|uniref:Gfo/Idh/MocA family protein n=1 Tax=Rubritalea profundi TaxID=1658618 RepID=UPI000CF5805A|nr:Gfo/Idh/MocA family oxidoreductase [Rubritalea profundi]